MCTMQVNAEGPQPGQTVISPEGDRVNLVSVKVRGNQFDVDRLGNPMILQGSCT